MASDGIDRSIVALLPDDPSAASAVRSMVAVGGALGIRVAAAWVSAESAARYEKLAAAAVKVLGGKRWREERLLGG